MNLEGGQAGSLGPLGTINPKKDWRRQAVGGGKRAEPRKSGSPRKEGAPGQEKGVKVSFLPFCNSEL